MALPMRAGMLSRIFRPWQQKAAAVTMSTGGYIPPDWPINFWQMGMDPLRVSGGAIVSACVAAYAQTGAQCPPSHWRSTGDGGRERVTTSALSRVMVRPNSYQSGSDFMLNLMGMLYTDGNAYALAQRNNRFEVDTLHLMRPDACGANVAAGEVFYTLGGNPVVESALPREALNRVPARDVLHLKLDARANPLRGEPPLTNALMDIAASNSMVSQALAFSRNSARPSGILTTDQALEDWQNAEIRQMWTQRTTGSEAGGTPILSSGLKWQQITMNSRDAQLAELLQIADGRIATVYRIPLSLLSLWGTQVQAGDEQMRHWVAGPFGFALNHVEDGIGKFFGLPGWPGEYLEFDTAALLRSAQRDRIEALARGVQGGIYSPNEARALEDLPAAEEGSEPRVQQQVVPLSAWADVPPATSAPAAPAAPEAAPANENDTAAAKAIGIAAIRRQWHAGA